MSQEREKPANDRKIRIFGWFMLGLVIVLFFLAGMVVSWRWG